MTMEIWIAESIIFLVGVVFVLKKRGDTLADIKKVIKGLESCVNNNCNINECPYCEFVHNEYVCLEDFLIRDALELLKEQEQKTGEWISIWREDDPDTSTSARCSVCNRISERPLGGFCKWCGAHMTE